MFLVISDDLEWCKLHLLPMNKNVVLAPKGKSSAEDLALISLGSHTIMSLGNYGLWGALLAGGEIVFPGTKFMELPYALQVSIFKIDDASIVKLKW